MLITVKFIDKYYYYLISIIIVLVGPITVDGINYKEFFAHVNPYLATELVQDYTRFSVQVNRALGIKEDEIVNESRKGLESSLQARTGTGLKTFEVDSNYKSAIGVQNILAVVRENIWDNLVLADTNLEQVVRSAPPTLPGFMGSLLKSAETDYNTKIRSIIFTPNWIKTTLRLSDLKTEVKQAYFDLPEQAMDTVNNVIRTRIPEVPTFLTEPLPIDTESLIVNMKHQKGHWSTATGYVGTTTFNGTGVGETVEMFELRGKFPFSQDSEFIYVTIPFKMTKLALTLMLPQENEKSRQLPLGDYAHFRLHLPVKTFVSRNPLKTADSNGHCDEKKGRDFGTCMEFLNTLSYTSFSPNEFQFININAGVVRRQGHLYPHQNRLRSFSFLEKWRYSVPPKRQYQYNFGSKIWKWRLPSAATNSYANYNNYNDHADVALVFNRPFFWSVRGTV